MLLLRDLCASLIGSLDVSGLVTPVIGHETGDVGLLHRNLSQLWILNTPPSKAFSTVDDPGVGGAWHMVKRRGL